MAIAHREANWGARTRASIQQEGKSDERGNDNQIRNWPPERTNHLASEDPNDAPAMSPATGPNREVRSDIESPTIEIRLEPEADVIVVAVTADQELRDALTHALPRDTILFADTPEQVLARPVPENCGVLVVEQTVGRAAFDKMKAHLEAAAPALVNVMVGTQSDGSSMVGLLSAGSIDRFMVKPLKLGPTRSALRSAIQQHQSLRPRDEIGTPSKVSEPTSLGLSADETSADTESDDAGEFPATLVVAHDLVQEQAASAFQAKATPKVVEVLRPMHVHSVRDDKVHETPKPARSHSERVPVLRFVPSESAPPRAHVEPTQPNKASRRAAVAQQPPTYGKSLIVAAATVVIVVAALIAWVLSMRAPELDVNKVIASHLATAHKAFALGSYVDPPELSAAHFYSSVLELDPNNAEAKRGLEAVGNRLIADSKQLIASGDLLRAQSALDNVRRVQPTHAELAAVTASLLNARESERLTIQAAYSASKPLEPTVSQSVATQSAATIQRPNTTSVGTKSASAKLESADAKVERNVGAQRPERLAAVGTVATNKVPVTERPVRAPASNAIPFTASVGSTASGELPLSAQMNPSASSQRAEQTAAVQPGEALSSTAKVAALSTASEMPSAAAVPNAAPIDATPAGTAPLATSDANKAKLIKYVPPVYPYKARAKGPEGEGWLDVRFMIAADGSVTDPQVEGGTLGYPFRKAAIAAVNQWKFSPTTNGAKSLRPMNVRLEFKLTD